MIMSFISPYLTRYNSASQLALCNSHFTPDRRIAIKNRMGWGFFLAMAMILVSSAKSTLAKDAPTAEIIAGEQGRLLDEVCKQRQKRGFSGSVLVLIQGKTILQKGYGLADQETQRPVTPESLFDIASLSKQFTAAAILALEQDGKLSLDDPLAKYLPGVPKAYRSVTLYQTLTHTGGLPRGGGGRGNNLMKAVKVFLEQPLSAKPGKAYAYSNVGYALLAGVVTKASGKKFEVYCRQRLFQPAQLSSIYFCGEKLKKKELVALGYTRNSSVGRTPLIDPYPPAKSFGYEYKGMGGVVTNVVELAKWIDALQTDDVLSADAREKLFTPNQESYACGWEVFSFSEGRRCIGHGGTVRGFTSKLWWFPDDEALLVVLANYDSFQYDMLNKLKDLMFREATTQEAR